MGSTSDKIYNTTKGGSESRASILLQWYCSIGWNRVTHQEEFREN